MAGYGKPPNQTAFIGTKNIEWTALPVSIRPPANTVGYVPVYWYNPDVPSVALGELDVRDDVNPNIRSTHIDLYSLNSIFIDDYPNAGDTSVVFTIKVDPIPTGSDSNISIRVSISKSGATSMFTISTTQVTLNSSNNFTGYMTASAASRFLSTEPIPPTGEGSISFITSVTNTSHPAYDQYDDLRQIVAVTIWNLGDRINRVETQDLPPENTAFESNGYYPLYSTENAAINASSLAGNYPAQSLQIKASSDLGDYTYYMPVGVPNYFGNYVPSPPPNDNNTPNDNNNNDNTIVDSNITPVIQP